MKKQTILLITLLFAIGLQAQVENSYLYNDLSQFPKEETQIQTNTNLVLVGEYLYYKISTLSNGRLSDISKIGYIELIDANNNTIQKHILTLEKRHR